MHTPYPDRWQSRMVCELAVTQTAAARTTSMVCKRSNKDSSRRKNSTHQSGGCLGLTFKLGSLILWKGNLGQNTIGQTLRPRSISSSRLRPHARACVCHHAALMPQLMPHQMSCSTPFLRLTHSSRCRVLLQNPSDLLPLKSGGKVLVAGPHFDATQVMLGNYHVGLQAPRPFAPGRLSSRCCTCTNCDAGVTTGLRGTHGTTLDAYCEAQWKLHH